MNQIALVTDGSNEACFSVNEKIHNFNVSFITTRKRSLGQGNVLTHVSFCSQEEGVCIGGGWADPVIGYNGIRSTSGQYASYWNILVSKNMISEQYKFKVQSISTNKCAKLTTVNTGTEVTDSGQVTPSSIGPFSRVTVGKKAL